MTTSRVRPKRLAIFVGILFVLPVSFLLSGLWIGPILQ